MADGMAGVIKQLQENNARQETLDQAILKQAVETKEIFLSSLGKLGESLRETLNDTSDDLTAAVLTPKQSPEDKKFKSSEVENQNRNNRNQGLLLKGIKGLGNQFGGFVKGIKDKTVKGFQDFKGVLGKLAIGGALIAFLELVNSKYWKDMVTLINEKILPVLKTFYEEILVPLGITIKDFFVSNWDNIKLFFTDVLVPTVLFLYEQVLKPLGETIKGIFVRGFEDIKVLFDGIGDAITRFKEGDILGGIITLIDSLGDFFINTVDNLITGVYNLFAGFFGLEETDSVFGEISRFITDTYENIKNTITDTYDAVKQAIKDAYDATVEFLKDSFTFVSDNLMEFNFFKFIEDALGDAIESIKAIFAGDFSMKNLLKGGKAFFDIVTYPLNLAINTVKDIFKFGDPDEPFRLSDFFFGPDGVISKAIDRITDLFAINEDTFKDFDLGDSAKRFLQGLLQAVLPPPDFLTLRIPSIDLGFAGKYGGGEYDLNPIPDAMYKAAGINPKTGRTFKEENEEMQAELANIMNEMYGSPTAAPGDAIFAGEDGRGNIYTTNNYQTIQNQSENKVSVQTSGLEDPTRPSGSSMNVE